MVGLYQEVVVEPPMLVVMHHGRKKGGVLDICVHHGIRHPSTVYQHVRQLKHRCCMYAAQPQVCCKCISIYVS